MRRSLVSSCLVGLLLLGCNAVLGIDPHGLAGDAAMSDGAIVDGGGSFDSTVADSARPDTASVPNDAHADTADATVDSSDDSMPVIVDGSADATDTGHDATDAPVIEDAPQDSRVDVGSLDAPLGDDGAPETGSTCTNACTEGLSECGAGIVQTCQLQANGCTQWTTTATCGTHQTCTAANGVAACTCDSSLCTQAGTVCQDSQIVATCATDANGCLYVASTAPCTAPEACAGSAPTAACSLTCTSSCTSGQTSCVSGQIATCTLGGNGCWSYGAPQSCVDAHQSCTGAAGAAVCSCIQDPVCAAPGTTCANSSTLATCSEDSQGCVYESSTTPCTGGAACVVSGTASCQCAEGTHDCSGSCVSNTSVSTCGTSCTACPVPDGGTATCDGISCGVSCGSETSCNGACVNEQTDPNNCGACGHSCLGGACSAGQCQPVVIVVSNAPQGLTFDSSNMYFDNSNIATIGHAGTSSVPTGSPPNYSQTELVAVEEPFPQGIGILPNGASELLIWGVYSRSNTGYIEACNPSNCSATLNTSWVPGPNLAAFITVDSKGVYWNTAGTSNSIQACLSTAGCATPVTVTTGTSLPLPIPGNDGYIYWLTSSNTLVRATPTAGATPAALVSNLTWTGGVPQPWVNGGEVFWYDGSSKLYSCPTTGCATPAVVISGSNLNGVLGDANTLYWSYGTTSSTFMSCSRANCSGTVQTLFTLTTTSSPFANAAPYGVGVSGVDAERVYIACYGNGNLGWFAR